MEDGETQSWLDAALACEYISKDEYEELNKKSEKVSYLLIYMINNPDKFK